MGLAQAKKGQMSNKMTRKGWLEGRTGRGDGSAEKREQEARTGMERRQMQRTWIQTGSLISDESDSLCVFDEVMFTKKCSKICAAVSPMIM